MSHYEDDFARHHMQAKHKRVKQKDIAKLRNKQDERNMAKLLGSWDDLVIDELKINN